jgi:hypothetical protein
MSDHSFNLTSTKQVQRAPVVQRLTLCQEIPHHTPLVLAAEDLQHLSDPRQQPFVFELPPGQAMPAFVVGPSDNASVSDMRNKLIGRNLKQRSGFLQRNAPSFCFG